MTVGTRVGRYEDFSSYLARNILLIFWLQSSANIEWSKKGETQAVRTAWAAMGLMYAKYPHPEPIERAVKLVMSRQLLVSSPQPSTSCYGAHAQILVLVTGVTEQEVRFARETAKALSTTLGSRSRSSAPHGLERPSTIETVYTWIGISETRPG